MVDKMVEAFFSDEIFDDLEIIEIEKYNQKTQPDSTVVITENKLPILKLNLYLHDESDCFRDIKISSNIVVVGFGHHIYFINTKTKIIESHSLECYFGHLYPIENVESNIFEKEVLVASSDHLYLFNRNGDLKWKSDLLGIDGVVIYDVKDSIVFGSGEHDPPGGWIDFKVSLVNGKTI